MNPNCRFYEFPKILLYPVGSQFLLGMYFGKGENMRVKEQSGFSLMEILVSLGISGIIMMIMAQMFSNQAAVVFSKPYPTQSLRMKPLKKSTQVDFDFFSIASHHLVIASMAALAPA